MIPIERITDSILLIRGMRVMVDADLARLYGVSTKRLNEQVRRNPNRFPVDFMFQLSKEEKAEVVANCDHLENLKYSPSLPYAFTEHGALMLASVLNSPKAVETSIYIVRALIRIREILATHKDLAQKLVDLEQKNTRHDTQIQAIVKALRELMVPEKAKEKRPIGFRIKEKKTVNTLIEGFTPVNSGIIGFDYFSGYAPDCPLGEYCPCLAIWSDEGEEI